MRLGLVLLVLSASTMVGYAHPRRPPPPPPLDSGLKDPFANSSWNCNTAKGWPKIKACLEKDHLRVNVLYDVEGAKLLALKTDGAPATTLRLYVQLGEQWQ